MSNSSSVDWGLVLADLRRLWARTGNTGTLSARLRDVLRPAGDRSAAAADARAARTAIEPEGGRDKEGGRDGDGEYDDDEEEEEGGSRAQVHEILASAVWYGVNLHIRTDILVFVHEFAAVLMAMPLREDGPAGKRDRRFPPRRRFGEMHAWLWRIMQSENSLINTAGIKVNVLVALTALFVEADLGRPLAASAAGEAKARLDAVGVRFLADLLKIVARVNNGGDVAVREIACECLREIEAAFPGILAAYLAELQAQAQAENTHASQAYLMLMTTTLLNAMRLARAGSVAEEALFAAVPVSLSDEPPPLGTESLAAAVSVFRPHDARRASSDSDEESGGEETGAVETDGGGYEGGGELGDFRRADARSWPRSAALKKHFLRCVSLVVDSNFVLTPWATALVVRDLAEIAAMTELPGNIFRHHFFPLIYSDNVLLCRVVLAVQERFPAQFVAADVEATVHRLAVAVADIQAPAADRQLVASWIEARLDKWAPLLRSEATMRLLFPVVFDPVAVKEAKVRVIYGTFRECVTAGGDLPEWLLSLLVCFDDFRAHKPPSAVVDAFFAALAVLVRSFPQLHRAVADFVLDIVRRHVHFDALIVDMLDEMASSDEAETRTFASSVLLGAHRTLSAMPPADLLRHLSVVDRVLQAQQLDPAPIIDALFQAVRDSDAWQTGSWELGDAVLSIGGRIAMLSHPTHVIHRPCAELLLFMARHYNDVEIRDRAHFYYQLLAHVSGSKLVAILSEGPVPDYSRGLELVTHYRPQGPQRIHVPPFLAMDRCPDADAADADVTNAEEEKEEKEEEKEDEDEDDKGAADDDGDDAKSVAESAVPPSPSVRALPVRKAWPTTLADGLRFRARALDAVSAKPATLAFLAELDGAPTPAVTLLYRVRFLTAAALENLRETLSPAASPVSLRRDRASTPTWSAAGGSESAFPDRVFGLQLTFSSDAHALPVRPVDVPYLECPTVATDEDAAGAFPHAYLCAVDFHPLVPQPARLSVSLTFNDDAGRVCRGDLPSLAVRFEDLCQPLRGTLPDFDDMWELVSDISLWRLALRFDEEREASHTVRRLDALEADVRQAIQSTLAPFLVSSDEDNARLLVHLAPCSHLLIRLAISPTATLATMRTNDSRMLPHLDAFLDHAFDIA